ncbi:MAG: hypothetical protein KatS3mg028_0658 [Bacteroidia bacterium]|nr:MAG: hypothetical protein KatS3mg028_0658 [Bacteroidia bacterium]
MEDGLTRFTIGGDFSTLDEAFQHNLKVIRAGQKDAFVLAIYKGKRVYLSDLVKLGIYVKKDEQLAKEVTKEYQPSVSVAETTKENKTIADTEKAPTQPSHPAKDKATAQTVSHQFISTSGISLNAFQEKIFAYSEKYGNISKENVFFSVQVGITKNPANPGFLQLKKFGKLQTIALENGVYAVYVGQFKTLNEALQLNKKIITTGGVKDAFAVAIYNNKRYYIHQLIDNKIIE